MVIIISYTLIIVTIIFLILIILIYNKFQKLKNGSEASLGQIKVALKKRLDLITQLANVVKAYSRFERSVFENITKMRSLIVKNIKTKDIDKININSTGLLKSIFAVVENYPDIKSSKNYLELMIALKDVESDILRQRYTYNNIVQEYNTKLDVIPSNIVAKIFSYKKLDYLKFKEDLEKLNLEMKD